MPLHDVAAGIAEGAVAQLFDSILAADASSVSIPNIPPDYNHLLLAGYTRGDRAAANDDIGIRFNNDSAANYFSQQVIGFGTTLSASEAIAVSAGRIFLAPANTATTNLFGSACALIANYANSTNKKAAVGLFAFPTGTTTGTIGVGIEMCYWTGTAAINQITVVPITGANLKAGSRFTLFGLGVL